jgi:hypothetical protein
MFAGIFALRRLDFPSDLWYNVRQQQEMYGTVRGACMKVAERASSAGVQTQIF